MIVFFVFLPLFNNRIFITLYCFHLMKRFHLINKTYNKCFQKCRLHYSLQKYKYVINNSDRCTAQQTHVGFHFIIDDLKLNLFHIRREI